MPPPRTWGGIFEVVNGASQFRFRAPEAKLVCSRLGSAAARGIDSTDSISYAVRSVLGARVIVHLPDSELAQEWTHNVQTGTSTLHGTQNMQSTPG
eukprot:15276800-Alexandrium_andersonii.AAC.1